jgi:hypothetical protein
MISRINEDKELINAAEKACVDVFVQEDLINLKLQLKKGTRILELGVDECAKTWLNIVGEMEVAYMFATQEMMCWKL